MPAKAKEGNPKPVLSIPVPHRLSNDVNSMLESTLQERFAAIYLVKKDVAEAEKGTWVLKRVPSKDGKAQVTEINSALGHLTRYVFAMTDAWTSGMGLSGDGSAVYVNKYTQEVLKVVPNLKDYDLYLVPGGRGGCAKYRISVQDVISQVTARAKVISSSLEKYGILAGKERTKKGVNAPEITVEF